MRQARQVPPGLYNPRVATHNLSLEAECQSTNISARMGTSSTCCRRCPTTPWRNASSVAPRSKKSSSRLASLLKARASTRPTTTKRARRRSRRRPPLPAASRARTGPRTPRAPPRRRLRPHPPKKGTETQRDLLARRSSPGEEPHLTRREPHRAQASARPDLSLHTRRRLRLHRSRRLHRVAPRPKKRPLRLGLRRLERPRITLLVPLV